VIILKEDSQTIKCGVEHCTYNAQKKCTLDEIKVAECEPGEEKKEATMCDSYKKE
jgi:hypothetical protein